MSPRSSHAGQSFQFCPQGGWSPSTGADVTVCVPMTAFCSLGGLLCHARDRTQEAGRSRAPPARRAARHTAGAPPGARCCHGRWPRTAQGHGPCRRGAELAASRVQTAHMLVAAAKPVVSHEERKRSLLSGAPTWELAVSPTRGPPERVPASPPPALPCTRVGSGLTRGPGGRLHAQDRTASTTAVQQEQDVSPPRRSPRRPSQSCGELLAASLGRWRRPSPCWARAPRGTRAPEPVPADAGSAGAPPGRTSCREIPESAPRTGEGTDTCVHPGTGRSREAPFQ